MSKEYSLEPVGEAILEVRRWRFWICFQADEHRTIDKARSLAEQEVRWLMTKGFRGKLWRPLPRHKTSGHFHVVILATLREKLSLAGIEMRR